MDWWVWLLVGGGVVVGIFILVVLVGFLVSNYPFDLPGHSWKFSDGGGEETWWGGRETWKSEDFILEPGILVIQFDHRGAGNFQVKLYSRGGVSGELAEDMSGIGGFIGQVVGGFGGQSAAGDFIGRWMGGKLGRHLERDEWLPEGSDKSRIVDIVRVGSGKSDDWFREGKYRLEVKAESKWSCRFIQPSINPSAKALNRAEVKFGNGVSFAGPFRTDNSKSMCALRHDGAGQFAVWGYSLDGKHSTYLERDGQFVEESVDLGLERNLHYMFLLLSGGSGYMRFQR